MVKNKEGKLPYKGIVDCFY